MEIKAIVSGGEAVDGLQSDNDLACFVFLFRQVGSP